MLSKNTLKQFKEFRALKKNKDNISKEQYFNELQKRLESVKADLSAPELNEKELKTLFKLLGDQKAN